MMCEMIIIISVFFIAIKFWRLWICLALILFLYSKAHGDFPIKYNKEFSKQEIMKITDACVRNHIKDVRLVTIVFAIRKSEGQRDDKYQFGIKHPSCSINDFNEQAGWCAATVQKNWDRYGGNDIMEFIEFLGKKYAPIGVDNDPNNLNKNWVNNVKFWYSSLMRII
jgi:hypothetical protein